MEIKADTAYLVTKSLRLTDLGWVYVPVAHLKEDLAEGTLLEFSHLFWTSGDPTGNEVGINFTVIGEKYNGPEFMPEELNRFLIAGIIVEYSEEDE